MWANMADTRKNFKHNFELYLNKVAIFKYGGHAHYLNLT
jgi:hypothetical protein